MGFVRGFWGVVLGGKVVGFVLVLCGLELWKFLWRF